MRLLKHKRLIASVAAVLVIVAVAIWPESLEVDAVPVTQGLLQVTVDEDGETRVRDRFVISAPVAGRMARIELEPGDRVVRGSTVLVRIAPVDPSLLDPRTRAELSAAVDAATAAVGQARAERDRAAAALERARATLERQQSLAAAGVVARDELEAAQVAVRTAEEAARAAEFAVRRAEYEVQLARARLRAPEADGRRIELVAPIDGVVLKRFKESEGVIAAGEPILEIGDPAQLEIVADLLSTDAVRVTPGDPVRIEQWGGGRPLDGRVRRVEPSGFLKVSALGVEEQRVNVVMDFVEAAAAARALGDGYRVEVRVVIWQSDGVVKVPIGSLFRRGDAWAVFVVNEGRAHLQPIELGPRNDREGQVLRGVAAGQTVVLHPPDVLTDGMRVRVRRG